MTRYYFAIEAPGIKPNDEAFWIVEQQLYDDTGELDDSSDTIDDDLPVGFYRLAEAVYEYEGYVEEGRERLLTAGFIEKNDLLY